VECCSSCLEDRGARSWCGQGPRGEERHLVEGSWGMGESQSQVSSLGQHAGEEETPEMGKKVIVDTLVEDLQVNCCERVSRNFNLSGEGGGGDSQALQQVIHLLNEPSLKDPSYHKRTLHNRSYHLKVPKCENFHRTDFFYFYSIKPLWVGDFRAKIKNSKF
jgi:hypothetical protein